jgi:hypothetical protein
MRRATRWAAVGCAALAAGCAGHGLHVPRLPRIGSSFMPPVVPYASHTATMSGRRWSRLREPAYDLYAQSPIVLPTVSGHLQATAQEFARHFGGAPRVAVLVFDAPADPTHEFDFSAFQEAGTQVLVFVRPEKAQRSRALGIDEGLMRARLAELFLASYADSVRASRTGRRDATAGDRALDRLPHWFAEAVISRVARPETVEPGLAFVRANRPQLVPLQRLFRVARLGTPAWCELAERNSATLATLATLPAAAFQVGTAAPPTALLAAESTVFGEFLVDRYGPTFLQAMADELLAGVPTELALETLPPVPDDGAPLEKRWSAWLARAGRR